MRCKKHKRYKAQLKPQGDCWDCWKIYLEKCSDINIVEMEIYDRNKVSPGCTYVQMDDIKQNVLNLLLNKKKEMLKEIK